MSILNSKPNEWNSVGEFFTNRSVLLTGGTGFLGKVLLEKFLHDCPDIKNIYVLVRTKGTTLAQSRLSEIIESQAFDRIRRIQPKLLDKIQIVRGDLTYDNLALTAQDLNTLKKDVSVFIHSAATIRFDEPLKRATRINVVATKRVLDLALQLKELKAFIHVSTAYCNQTKKNIKESVYPEILTPEKLIELTEDLNDNMLESLTPHLFGDRPSSYHYTKAMAENLVRGYCDRLPLGIVRPSIITASFRDPFPGWTDNYNGPTGYLVSAGKGILRTLLVDGKKICDAIPVDIVASTVMTSAWHVANQNVAKKRGFTDFGVENEPFVVNCTTGQINPITWRQIKTLSHPWLIRFPSMEMFRYPNPIFVSNKTLHKIILSVEHGLPTFVIDLIFKSLGHKPMLGPIYQKVHRTTAALEFFTTNEWIYETGNFQALNNELSVEDRSRFLIDVKQIDWPLYMKNYVLGVRQYLLKEDPSTIDTAKFRLDLLYYTSRLTEVTITGLSCYCFYKFIYLRRRELINKLSHGLTMRS